MFKIKVTNKGNRKENEGSPINEKMKSNTLKSTSTNNSTRAQIRGVGINSDSRFCKQKSKDAYSPYKPLINPYGTRWHERLQKQDQPCAECGVRCMPEFVLAQHGYPEPLALCSPNCLIKFSCLIKFRRKHE